MFNNGVFGKVVVGFLLCALFCSPASADENGAMDQSCALMAAFVSKDGTAAKEQLGEMFSWNEQLGSAANSFGVLERLKYVGGELFNVGDLGKFYQEHLLVISTEENGTLYFRLTYERFKGSIVLLHISFKDNLKDIVREHGPFVQDPAKVDC